MCTYIFAFLYSCIDLSILLNIPLFENISLCQSIDYVLKPCTRLKQIKLLYCILKYFIVKFKINYLSISYMGEDTLSKFHFFLKKRFICDVRENNLVLKCHKYSSCSSSLTAVVHNLLGGAFMAALRYRTVYPRREHLPLSGIGLRILK